MAHSVSRRASTFTLLSVGSIVQDENDNDHDDDDASGTSSPSKSRKVHAPPDTDNVSDRSHIDDLIEGYRKADRHLGAMSLRGLLYNKYDYVAKIRLVEHLTKRIGEYMTLLDTISVHPWDSGTALSGVWQMIFLLGKVHREFREADPFTRQLLEYLEKDVRGVLGNWQVERGRDAISSPWTDRGREALEALVKHLAATFEDTSSALPKGIRSVYEAVKVLRAPYKKMTLNERINLSSEEYDGLKDYVKQRLFKEGHKNRWWNGGLSRAFAIGLADLWRANDFKAILYILRQAQKLHEQGQRLGTLKASLEDSVSMAENTRLQILTGAFAVLVGALNQMAKFGFRWELLHAIKSFNATSSDGL